MKIADHQTGGMNGTDSFEQYMSMTVSDQGTPEERIEMLRKALVNGLPENDEIKARAFLGSELFTTGNDEEGINQYELSLKMASNSVSVCEDDTMALLFRKLCRQYILIAKQMEKERGREECLAFLESKTADLKDLSSPALYVELATVLAKNGDIQQATIYFSKATICHRVEPLDRKAENLAWELLSKIAKTDTGRRVIMAGQAVFPMDIRQEKGGVRKKLSGLMSGSVASQTHKKINITRYFIAAAVAGVLIIGGILVASYLSTSQQEPEVSPVTSVPEKTEPPKSLEAPKPEETPEPLPAPSIIISPAEPPLTRPNETAKKEKIEKRPKKTVPKISERTIERPSEPPRGKSFAPRSRDDL
jgi:hypothetical protein